MSKRTVRVRVYHSVYGCETGCCGHVIEVDEVSMEEWTFDHHDPVSDGAVVDWAREQIEACLSPKHRADLDWDNAVVDWDLDEVNRGCA